MVFAQNIKDESMETNYESIALTISNVANVFTERNLKKYLKLIHR